MPHECVGSILGLSSVGSRIVWGGGAGRRAPSPLHTVLAQFTLYPPPPRSHLSESQSPVGRPRRVGLADVDTGAHLSQPGQVCDAKVCKKRD